MINHISIIPDGNRRYSKKYNITLEDSIQKGIDQVFNVSKWFFENSVSEISIFGFSENNWKREKSQIDLLHNLFLINSKRLIHQKNKLKNTRIKIFGDLSKFEKPLINNLIKIQQITLKGGGNQLNIGLNYSSSLEVQQMVDNCLKQHSKDYKNFLQVKNDVDLVLRTGNHHRISNFLPIQSGNAEFFFSEKLWSELNEKDVRNICNWYNRQERNLGI